MYAVYVQKSPSAEIKNWLRNWLLFGAEVSDCKKNKQTHRNKQQWTEKCSFRNELYLWLQNANNMREDDKSELESIDNNLCN